ncbi:MAG: hypothetical protein D6689_13730 [Deltaproteobacteria bacterium]|nr:MAG: hypothetical protein D6689_13730 [Deltaproteobacteria bacterium]
MADLRSSKRKTLANAVATTLLATAGIVLVNVAVHRARAGIDLSGEGLTRASELLVAGLEEPMQVTAYFGNIPPDNQFEQRYVEQLLDNYARASDGKFTWRKVDPFDRGQEFQRKLREDEGIDKLMWLSIVDDAPQQVPVYFHVQFRYLDKSEVWAPAAKFSLRGLEYEFSSIIKKLAYPKKKVGVTTGFGSPAQIPAIEQLLSDLYDVETVDLSASEVDLSPYDLLIVNGPTQPLTEAAKLAIDGHVLAGKPTVFLLKGMNFTSPGAQPGMPQFGANQPLIGMPADAGLGDMLRKWGVEVESNIILDPQNGAPGPVFVGEELLMTRLLFPLAEAIANGEGEPLEGISLFPVPYATTVKLVGSDPQIEAIELARTAPTSFARTDILPLSAGARVDRGDAPSGPFTVGVALQGRFPSAFASAPPAAPDSATGGGAPDATSSDADAGGAGAGPTRSSANTRMVVFGSADLVNPTLLNAARNPLLRAFALGADVLTDLVDWAAADQALVAARSRGAPPPIKEVDKATKTLINLANVGGSALAILLAGFAVRATQNRRRRSFRLDV